jgi:hypothetical protein
MTADAPVVYAELAGMTCSICAPIAMAAAEVEAFANDNVDCNFGKWVTVNKAKLGLGAPTPNPCDCHGDRLHWFLLSEVNAAMLVGEVRR